jgi:hypothetical protein
MLNRDQLLTSCAMPREVIDVPELGGQVLAQGLNGLDWADYNDSLLVEQKKGQRRIETRRVHPNLVVRGLVDEAGARLLSDDDAPKIAKAWPAAVLARLYLIIARLSGAADEEPEKNSASVPASSSSTS